MKKKELYEQGCALRQQYNNFCGEFMKYRIQYKEHLNNIIKTYGLDGKVEFDKKALCEKKNEGTHYEYFGREKHTGKLCIYGTGDLERPFGVCFQTEETDDDGLPICRHRFEELNAHGYENIAGAFEKEVLPYIHKIGEKH